MVAGEIFTGDYFISNLLLSLPVIDNALKIGQYLAKSGTREYSDTSFD